METAVFVDAGGPIWDNPHMYRVTLVLCICRHYLVWNLGTSAEDSLQLSQMLGSVCFGNLLLLLLLVR